MRKRIQYAKGAQQKLRALCGGIDYKDKALTGQVQHTMAALISRSSSS